MTAPESLELKSSDLRLLSHFYQNDFGLELSEGPDGVTIDPPQSTWKSMVVMTVVIGVFFSGFVWVAIAADAGGKFGPLIWVVIAMAGILAVVGPVVAHQLRLAYLRTRSPLVAYSTVDLTVSIIGGQKSFPSDVVYALIGVTLQDAEGESKSELQLITREGHSFVPHLITTDLSGSASQSYGKVLRRFRETTGIKALIAEPLGLLHRGPVHLTEV